MRNEENIDHIVRGTQYVYCPLVYHLSREVTKDVESFFSVV